MLFRVSAGVIALLTQLFRCYSPSFAQSSKRIRKKPKPTWYVELLYTDEIVDLHIP